MKDRQRKTLDLDCERIIKIDAVYQKYMKQCHAIVIKKREIRNSELATFTIVSITFNPLMQLEV